MSVEGRIVYFEKPGWRCTEEVLAICKRRADERGIKTAVLPSATGSTAMRAVEVLTGMKLVVVTVHTGYARANLQSFPEARRRELIDKGVSVVTAPHVFGGLSYAMLDMYGTATLGVDMGNTLRTLGQGMKVVIECPMAAMDAGLLTWGEEIISMGGTNRGVDTAVTLKPVHVRDFFSLRINEILCKPLFDN
ncbi:MAG: hypothetical protein NTY02_07705 [Acidobacteria bacterium]|nr:hypothetical protein [Acidobacteriota bacterium]